MQVREIMSSGVECIGPDASLADAARKMKDLDIGALPVCEQDRLSGIITDRDIVVRAIATGKDPQSTKVKDAMSTDVCCCSEDDDIQEAARLMKEKQIRRLVVMNQDQRIVGIVSLGDLATESEDEHLKAETLEEVSQPA